MPSTSTKAKQDRWIPAVIAALVLIGVAIWGSLFLPTEEAPADTPRLNPTTAFATQTLRSWDGRLARFEKNADTPAEVYDVAVASLPLDIRRQLENGIVVTSEDQLFSLLENLTS